jgi:glycosyltransferase involved in cell wall biosynthesis
MLSFVVPAYNEQLELPETLAAIHTAACANRTDYEIIVVDDGSTDATGRLAEAGGAEVITIHRRQIAAARNAGARAAKGDVLFFVDADTRIEPYHISRAVQLLKSGCSGGGARIKFGDEVPLWGRIFASLFGSLYFAANLGAGAFLFTTTAAFHRAGGFDEQYFAGEEVYFTLALKKLGPFKLIQLPVATSGRKLRMYSAGQVLGGLLGAVAGGKRTVRNRNRLDLWYDGKRETRSPVSD